jgi:hypothetical protein
MPGLGICDPQIRVWGDEVFLYATHDARPDARDFEMHDWRIWRSRDLVDWRLAGDLRPEQTYLGKPSAECWATDAAQRDGRYYLYFSMGPENIGVVVADRPAGPWRDPLGKPLIPKGLAPTASRDPGILQDQDGENYIVFGTFNYYIARLNPDMISLAEPPRKIAVERPEGPLGKGRTDDKPFLHRRGEVYYLSWGCYYAMSASPYGPFVCKGSILQADQVDPVFRTAAAARSGPLTKLGAYLSPRWLQMDRHGSFFDLHGQSYFACNDQALAGSTPYFRNWVLTYVRYRANGEIAPVRLTTTGVGRYDADVGVEACDFFRLEQGRVMEAAGGGFELGGLVDGSAVFYPRIENLRGRRRMAMAGRSTSNQEVHIEIRRSSPAGALLGRARLRGEGVSECGLAPLKAREDICLIVRGGRGELARLGRFDFL